MAETTVIHTIPSETTISEDITTVLDDLRVFYHNNRDLCLIVGAVATAVLLNRSILRRELKRLSFSAEFYPFDMIDDDTVSESLAYLGE